MASRVLSSFLLQPVGPKAGTPGTAATPTPGTAAPPDDAPAKAQPAPQSTWILLAPMLVVVVFMMFTSRSQKKREAETRAKLKKGDRVVSQSGLVGELVDLADGLAKVKIAPGTNVQMLIGSISPYEPAAAASTTDKSLKDLKDAKATPATDKKG